MTKATYCLLRKNQSYLGGNHLKDLLAQSKVVVLVYDDKQIMNKSQIWTDNTFLELEHEVNLEGNLIELRNQMRISANSKTIDWIRCIIDEGELRNLKKMLNMILNLLILLWNYKMLSNLRMLIKN